MGVLRKLWSGLRRKWLYWNYDWKRDSELFENLAEQQEELIYRIMDELDIKPDSYMCFGEAHDTFGDEIVKRIRELKND